VSVALNLEEGSGSCGGTRNARYRTALGSARETGACIDVAMVAPGKPGRRKHELRSERESPRRDPAGNQPRAGRLVSTGQASLAWSRGDASCEA